MNTKDIETIVIKGVTYYNFVEACLVLDLTPSSMRYCIPNGELVDDNGVLFISEDALWKNLYRQSKQYYRDQQTLKMINSTNPLF